MFLMLYLKGTYHIKCIHISKAVIFVFAEYFFMQCSGTSDLRNPENLWNANSSCRLFLRHSAIENPERNNSNLYTFIAALKS